jgi:hypothetical protein
VLSAHTALRARGIAAATGGAMALCLALSACGGSSSPPAGSSAAAASVNAAPIEAAIARSIYSARHLTATVSCPRDVPRARGVVFACVAMLADGSTPFVVTETNATGGVSYIGCGGALTACGMGSASSPVLNSIKLEHAIEQSIQSSRGVTSSVVCPTGVPRQTGIVFECLARLTHGVTPFDVTETDGQGNVSYVGR